jgi:hypothetical protein
MLPRWSYRLRHQPAHDVVDQRAAPPLPAHHPRRLSAQDVHRQRMSPSFIEELFK